MARIRTLNFLPEVFQTSTNSQFLSATLDQLVNDPVTSRLQGYIGNKFGPGTRISDSYIIEPTKERNDYQLEPGVVFTKPDEETAKDFISYPEMISAINLAGGNTSNHNRLFNSEIYSWDSFVDLDKVVNFHEYYWLQDGPPPVSVSPNDIFTNIDFNVFSDPNSYRLEAVGTDVDTGPNPVISLLRGGTYNFIVNQDSPFWIQTEIGITGTRRTQSFVSTREVFGVQNNGATQGTVTFNVPFIDSQDSFIFEDEITADLVSDLPFDQINGKPLRDVFDVATSTIFPGVNSIDGITGLDGARIFFANSSVGEIGYISSYYDEMFYDINDDSITNPKTVIASETTTNSIVLSVGTTDHLIPNQTITIITDPIGGLEVGQVYFVREILSQTEFTISKTLGGSEISIIPQTGMTMTLNINQGQYEQGFYTNVSENFYRIQYIGDPANPVIRLLPDGAIPERTNLIPRFGNNYINRAFYKNSLGVITLVPSITAPISTLYYVDGNNPNRVGIIKLVDANDKNFIDIEEEILGKISYTSPNGVEFTNGLKVNFDGNIFPERFRNGTYYVEQVGTGIKLIDTKTLEIPEPFTIGEFSPFDTVGYDLDSFDIQLNLPVDADYITIARNSISRDAWARSNRWFHGDVIRKTAQYNRNSAILDRLLVLESKAKRPIIEFKPDLKLFNSGIEGKELIDFFDTRTLDGLSEVPGLINYYPDSKVNTLNTAVVSPTVGPDTTVTVSVSLEDITGAFEIGMFVGDTNNLLPPDSQVIDIQTIGNALELTISYSNETTILGGITSLAGSDTQITSQNVFPGARIVFANDANPDTRREIYVVNRVLSFGGTQPVITLSRASDGFVSDGQQVTVKRGFNNQGKTFFYDNDTWIQAQQKVTVNQPPLFDVFDNNGTSFGNPLVYNGTSFNGSTLFSFGINSTGMDDPILGFPVRYSDINNIGDISFDVSVNSDTFTYSIGTQTFTQNVNTGYVHQYKELTEYQRLIGWVKSADESMQYLQYDFNFEGSNTFICDVAPISQETTAWPVIKVFIDSKYQLETSYTVLTTADSTTITLGNDILEGSTVQIFILSNQITDSAFYTVPDNLSNNPFNANLNVVDLGDIRNHYRDIFINAPGISGNIFGINNYRDLGDLSKYGTKIIKNSASLALSGLFLRNQDFNIINSLMFSSREYVKYKQMLVNLANESNFFDEPISLVLDRLAAEIAANRSEINSFFWTDMLPVNTVFSENTYSFNSDLDITRYPLHKVYDFKKASYESVLVYLRRNIGGIIREIQLLKDVEYIIDFESPSLSVIRPLMPGDNIVIKEYNQTFGSYCPYTPSKLGLYPISIPQVILDNNYTTPTYFIKGHDGSFTKLYGNYDPGLDYLSDIRDRVLLEFEKRVYNNIKLPGTVFNIQEMMPGFFRETDYSFDEWLSLYSANFLDWIGQNRIEFTKQFFQLSDEFSFNYKNSTNKLTNKPLPSGNFRGLYQYFYDTFTPESTPWEMLGFANKPVWWEERYGPAPYTSENLLLWEDLEKGIAYDHTGNFIIDSKMARPGLLKIIPVDSTGKLKSPLQTIVGNYNSIGFQKNWQVGDVGPAELAYRRSSSYPFDMMKMLSLSKPAKFFNLGIDIDKCKFNDEFNQYLINDREHLDIRSVEVYGDGIAKTSLLNWVVDYARQFGIGASNKVRDALSNLDVRLIYRLAGFSDQNMLNFFVEKSSPSSANSSLLIPEESYSILLHDNQASDRIIYSSVIIQKTNSGFAVFGNSQTNAFFRIYKPILNSNTRTLTVINQRVTLAKDYTNQEQIVSYGTVFRSVQELAQFLMNYDAYLRDKGVKYTQVIDGNEVDWILMIKQFLYWTQLGWDAGSIITLNPLATELVINKEDHIVQPLSLTQQNFILNQDLYPIQTVNLCINRDGTEFKAHTLNDGDTMSFAAFNMSNIEHGAVFNNTTLFNDVIYNLTTGLRQNRMIVRGTKTANWNGTVNSSGFILSQDNINEWTPDVRYPKGVMVKYKNNYYSANTLIQPSSRFDETLWTLVDTRNVQKGLLPNNATRAFESILYYDTNRSNLDVDADLLSYSLIGYRPRDYMKLADLTRVAEINVYKNMIKSKGTLSALKQFDNTKLIQGDINYELFEHWAIKKGEYGGKENDNFVEFLLDNEVLTNNPSIVSLHNGTFTSGSLQEVSLSAVINYKKFITDPNILSTVDNTKTSIFPYAGYVNFNDVKMSSFFYAGLRNAVNKENIEIPIQNFYVRDYFWLANFKEKWGVFTWKPFGIVVEIQPNIDNTATITFDSAHGLSIFDPISIINFSNDVDGYYIVSRVVNLNQVVINLSLPVNNNRILTGAGIALLATNQRVKSPTAISNLDLNEAEFIKNTVWVDENTDGNWAVYRKTNNYSEIKQVAEPSTLEYGKSVAFTKDVGTIVSDPAAGKIYRYALNPLSNEYELLQTIEQDTSFGTAIAHANNIFAISQPETDPTLFLYHWNKTIATNDLFISQTIDGPVSNWGTAVEFSQDGNWLFVSSTDESLVYVYRKTNIEYSAEFIVPGRTYSIIEVGDTDFLALGSDENKSDMVFVANGPGTGSGRVIDITFEFATTIDGNLEGLGPETGFGSGIATDQEANIVAITAPTLDFNSEITDWGSTVIYQRATQTFDVQQVSQIDRVQEYKLGWTVGSSSATVVSTNSTGNIITLSDTTGFVENFPVVFRGNGLLDTNIVPNITYYVRSISGNNITLKTSRNTNNVFEVATKSFINGVTAVCQTDKLLVTVNGKLVQDNNYATDGHIFIYSTQLNAGDILKVTGNEFFAIQTLNSDSIERPNHQFGYAIDINNSGSELLIGSPYELNDAGNEGQVYRYTNVGAKYGMVMGNTACNITQNREIYINGYQVTLQPGNAEINADIINSAKINNIRASFTADNRLLIQVIDKNLAQINRKLIITSFDKNVFLEAGISLLSQTQKIVSPHNMSPAQFGSAIKFNEFNSVVIGAPSSSKMLGTKFDFTDDESSANDTIFDNNATRFVESFENYGASYMFDLMEDFNGNQASPGKFIYAQPVNNAHVDFLLSPKYGSSIDFNDNVVIIGAPSNINEAGSVGLVSFYENVTGKTNWSVFRSPSPVVDIDKIQNVQVFSTRTNTTLSNLDYIDPLQGKILGVARENIDFISNIDPAFYNNSSSQRTWGEEQVGMIWLDTTNIRFVDYHQDDVVYNSEYWGQLFPGSDISVYTWVESASPPNQYQGPGIVFDVNKFAVSSTLNSSNVVSPVYYFWVRNTNKIAGTKNKKIADAVIASYIQNPKESGISFMAPVLPNAFALYNVAGEVNTDGSALHIGYATSNTLNITHNEYALIRTNNDRDFLNGYPGVRNRPAVLPNRVVLPSPEEVNQPTGLYLKLLDSLAGCNSTGQIVPDPFLPTLYQTGILNRPRQSFFINRRLALQNYLTYANEIIKSFPIVEIRSDLSFLFETGEFFDTTDYWKYKNWWLSGFDDSTRASLQVSRFSDLFKLNVSPDTLVKVERNGEGLFEIYRFERTGNWTRIGLEKGTIEFSDKLWNYIDNNLGFSADFFDILPYDTYPSEETRNIIRAINEQIFIDELEIHKNKSLIMLFDYIVSEANETQNNLTWLHKTSLVEVEQNVRELLPFEILRSDNEQFLEGYIEEVKPYHVTIKEFLSSFDGKDNFVGDISDFDLPAKFNQMQGQFISPKLINGVGNGVTEFGTEAAIWSEPEYNNWFKNVGLQIRGIKDYKIAVLRSYVDISDRMLTVDNASGFPTAGVVTIGGEKMSYSGINRDTNTLLGLSRGLENTTIVEHIPGEVLTIDLPPVVVLDEGSGYSSIPRVTAFIDTNVHPAPRVEAELQAVLSGTRVTGIRVLNPGDGYAVLPEIRIDPAYEIAFSTNDINSTLNTINVFAPELRTGDLVRFRAGSNGGKPTKLVDNEWYYVRVLESLPSVVIALYRTVSEANRDENRIAISTATQSSDMKLLPGARASVITTSEPIRENNITIRFDRTSYISQVKDWEAESFYGGFFSGDFYNSERISSSSIILSNVEPDINNIFASAAGIAFEIQNVEEEVILSFSSFARVVGQTNALDNTIVLVPQDGNNPDLSELADNASGTTIGFYKNMPIKFSGAGPTEIIENRTYYVSRIFDELRFTISDEIDGPEVQLTDFVVSAQGYRCFTGQNNSTTILTVRYPGIHQVTRTEEGTNRLTIPMSPVGTGGTAGFYTNLPIFFTENAFGNVVENIVYYVTTVIDSQTFTMSEAPDPVMVAVTQTDGITNQITLVTIEGIAKNDPVIFTEVDGLTNSIEPGRTYYVSEVIPENKITISEFINGPTLTLGNSIGNKLSILANQKDTVKLINATGSMTLNVELPVSPGQVDGQLFNFYESTPKIPGISSELYSKLIKRSNVVTIGNGRNRIALPVIGEFGTFSFYNNLPITVSEDIGGLIAGQTYYVTEYSGRKINEVSRVPNTTVEVLATSSAGNRVIATINPSEGLFGTTVLYEGMPLTFTGPGLGNIDTQLEYFVREIINTTEFTISTVAGGPEFVLSTASGNLLGTGDPYIEVSTTRGGTSVTLTDSSFTTTSLNQQIEETPSFNISSMLGGYVVQIEQSGLGFAVNNVIEISGLELGGKTPDNDLRLTVNTIGDNGEIRSVIVEGNPAGIQKQYYLKVRSPNQLEVYENSILTVPVSKNNFDYQGYATALINSATANTLNFDTSEFEDFDLVVFTGNVPSVIETGKTYYLFNTTPVSAQITTVPNDPATAITGIVFNSEFTIAKLQGTMLLPEPFFFNQSIVRFNNRLYVCSISNNDKEFIIGKWELLDSGDRRLNAMDRVAGYYQPTDDMPSANLSQLFAGVTYPNSVYKANEFEPSRQFVLDTVLSTVPFAQVAIDIKGIIYHGKYYVIGKFENGTGVFVSDDLETWELIKLTDAQIELTSINIANNTKFITSENIFTPIFKNEDEIWTTSGYYMPGSGIPLAIDISNVSMNAISYFEPANLYIGVGQTIVSSTDKYVWTEVQNFDSNLENSFNDIVTTDNIVVVVGIAKRLTTINNLQELVTSSTICYSHNGVDWTQIEISTDKAFTTIVHDGSKFIVSGESEVLYTSLNGIDWTGISETPVIFANAENGILNVGSTAGLEVGTQVFFTNSFSSVVADTIYVVSQIISDTQLTIAETTLPIMDRENNPVLDRNLENISVRTLPFTTITIPENTMMIIYAPETETINDMIFVNNTWIAVGNNGRLKVSSDGNIWTVITIPNLTANLFGIAFNENTSQFIAVGDENTVLISDDNGATWNETSILGATETTYAIRGTDFNFGYAPEELVGGVVKDKITITPITTPGTNWSIPEYGHSGFNVVTVTLDPEFGTQTEFSFGNIVQIPAEVRVQVIDGITGQATSIYEGISYEIDWVSKTIKLSEPLRQIPVNDSLLVSVFEIGNGFQIAKSSTDVVPIRTNPVSGFNEIYLNCNYTGEIFEGTGAVKPGTSSLNTRAFRTEALAGRIFCDDVSSFTLSSPITFQGISFGGLQENAVYYVSSISTATNAITVSDVIDPNTGSAGATIILQDAVGEMFVNIESGLGELWSPSVLIHNGTRLKVGGTGFITATTQSNNTIVTSTTNGLTVGTPITFCQCEFGTIEPFRTYFVKSIVSDRRFTISRTIDGEVEPMVDFNDLATFITNDYTIFRRSNGQASILLAGTNYNIENDYFVFSVFGEEQVVQRSHSLPETQNFDGDGLNSKFFLQNFSGGDNPDNAIIEINGTRLTKALYEINPIDNSILLDSPPLNGETLSVTTFNDTTLQYMNTQFNITGNPETSLLSLVVIETIHKRTSFDQNMPEIHTFDQNTPELVTYDEFLNYLVLGTGTTADININDSIVFQAPTLGGLIEGRVYYIRDIIDNVTFTVSEEVAGDVTEVFNDTGTMSATANGLIVSEILSIDGNIAAPFAITNAFSSTAGTPNRITVASLAGFAIGQPVQFFGISFDPNLDTDGTVYFIDSIDTATSSITIRNFDGFQIQTFGGTGLMQVVVGDRPTVRVRTKDEHGFIENSLVRMDGIDGAVQLNNGVYYAKIIDPFTFDIYNTPYTSGLNAVNDPVTVITAYTGSGYVWRQGLFFLSSNIVTETNTSGQIFVNSTDNLISGTPVYFSSLETQFGTTLTGGIIQGKEYFIQDIGIDNLKGPFILVTDDRGGNTVTFTNDIRTITLMQWKHQDPARLYVTVNGKRIPASNIKINDTNEVSILTKIVPGDQVIITSMIPTSTPNEFRYLNIVNSNNIPSVYRIRQSNTDWLTESLSFDDEVMFVRDVTKLTNSISNQALVPAIDNGFYNIGLFTERNLTVSIAVFNNTTGQIIPGDSYSLTIKNLTPTLQIIPGSYINEGDLITIDILEGSPLYVNGEIITFTQVDFVNNTISGLARGRDGTGQQTFIEKYTNIYSLAPTEKLPENQYTNVWNTNVYNQVKGDPLQISNSFSANFLNGRI